MAFTYAYPRPAVTTDAIVIGLQNNEYHILLIKRGIDPFKGCWALPGGFVEMDEELEAACSRELKEESNITGVQLQQFATFGTIGRDPRHRTISVVYWAITNSLLQAKSGDDAASVQWFKLNNLPPLAFDHKEIIEKFIREKMSSF